MIDIHCHILPGIDDGATSVAESIEMARIACNDGIKAVVATPHVFESNPSAEHIKSEVKKLGIELKNNGLNLKITSGAEIAYPAALSNLDSYGINGTRNIIVEFPHSYLPINSGLYIKEMISKGYYPIIAHPERNPAVLKSPDKLFELIEKGASVQITSSSLAGDFGRDTQALSVYLLKKNAVHFIASDSHGIKGRKPVISNGLKYARKFLTEKEILRLVYENPLKVLEGKRVS